MYGAAPFGSLPFSAFDQTEAAGGDTLRNAFRLNLESVLELSGWIDWPHRDTLNTGLKPDASTGYFELEFAGGSEEQFTSGAPTRNFYRERGQVTIRAVVRQNAGLTERNKAESYIEAVRMAFRSARFVAGSRNVRITSTGAMGGGETEAGMWAESIALAYEVYSVG
ncbi:MAG TPA: hypothetical protein VK634_15025 [Reyranella sp.]|nr:hypothetical protein [Reyranella sp.]HTE81997.1 hypothetical protein [Reyranella sp.]